MKTRYLAILAALAGPVQAVELDIDLSWKAPVERRDGTLIEAWEINKYTLYYSDGRILADDIYHADFDGNPHWKGVITVPAGQDSCIYGTVTDAWHLESASSNYRCFKAGPEDASPIKPMHGMTLRLRAR